MSGRYFAGKAPNRRADSASDDGYEDDDNDDASRQRQRQRQQQQQQQQQRASSTKVQYAQSTIPTTQVTEAKGGIGKATTAARRLHAPIPNEDGELPDDEEEDDDPVQEESLHSQSEYETEASDDSEAEEEERRRATTSIRPVFRTTLQQQQQQEVRPTEIAGGKPGAQAVLERFIQHQQEVEVAAAKFSSRLEDVDDTDGLDPEGEYQAWRLRELLRIKRDRDVLEAREKERDEIEARRAMPEEERLAQDTAAAIAERQQKIADRQAADESGSGGQSYHHRGAFYQDDDIVHRKMHGTVEGQVDGRDRRALPPSLQRRNLNDIGKRGATRWTRLADEDTSRNSLFDNDARDQIRR